MQIMWGKTKRVPLFYKLINVDLYHLLQGKLCPQSELWLEIVSKSDGLYFINFIYPG